MMMIDDLNLCPICGAETVVLPEEPNNIGYMVACTECDCNQEGYYETQKDAIDAWNDGTDMGRKEEREEISQ